MPRLGRRDKSVPSGVNESEAACFQTPCATGGCPDSTSQVAGELCVNLDLQVCHSGACFKETCCEETVLRTCCRRSECERAFQDCSVPKQLSTKSSTSVLGTTKLAHGTDGAPFPFYSAATERGHVPEGTTCADAHVWGTCACDDGQLLPGCLAADSSTWAPLEADAAAAAAGEGGSGGGGAAAASASGARLPPGLSLTCTEAAVTPAGGGSASGGGAAHGGTADPDSTTLGQPPDSGLSVGTIIGIVVGSMAGGALLAVCGWLAWVGWRAGGLSLRTVLEAMGVSTSYAPVGGLSLMMASSSTPGRPLPQATRWSKFASSVAAWASCLVPSRLRGRGSGGSSSDVERPAVAAVLGGTAGAARVSPGWKHGAHSAAAPPPSYEEATRQVVGYGDSASDDDAAAAVFTLEDLGGHHHRDHYPALGSISSSVDAGASGRHAKGGGGGGGGEVELHRWSAGGGGGKGTGTSAAPMPQGGSGEDVARPLLSGGDGKKGATQEGVGDDDARPLLSVGGGKIGDTKQAVGGGSDGGSDGPSSPQPAGEALAGGQQWRVTPSAVPVGSAGGDADGGSPDEELCISTPPHSPRAGAGAGGGAGRKAA
ncbi:hypothetical protein FOA52_011986 [Chlamydomonas sp. UWO 241]|nr:hypothetical protein FOA52_011986 [Chlamydomonas sp. UWO 241]